MDYLEIRNRPYHAIRVGLGIIMILIALTWIVLYYEDKKLFDLVLAVTFILTGIYHMTDGFGIEKSWIRGSGNILTIKWLDRIRAKRIVCEEIGNICLGRFSILFNLKAERPFKIKLGYMGMNDKKDIYEFLMSYAREHNIVIFRNPDPKQ